MTQLEPEKKEDRWKFVSIRTLPEFKKLLQERAAREGMDYSAWCREVLAMVMAANVHVADLADLLKRIPDAEEPMSTPTRGSQPGKRRLGARVAGRAKCLHPLHLRSQMVTFDVCSCGKQFAR